MYEEQTLTVLFVHGRGFKPAAETLSSLSFDALRAGVSRDYPLKLAELEKARLEFAYYGDLTDGILRDRGQHYDETVDVADRKKALDALKKIPARKRFGIRQYDRLPGKSAIPEFIADMTMPLFALVGLTLPVVSKVAPDFAHYLKATDDRAAQIRERVRARIADALKRGDRLMLVTHGMGAAVAWDALWELSHDEQLNEGVSDVKIDTWVTLGAPLGDSGILRRLKGGKEKGLRRFPTNVMRWVNLSAEDDYACHDQTLADDFKAMIRERILGSIEDFTIYNLALRFGRSNPHSSIGYYIHPRLVKIIADWLPEVEAPDDTPTEPPGTP